MRDLYLSFPYWEDNLYHLCALEYWFLSSLEIKSAFLVMPRVALVILQCRLFGGSLAVGFFFFFFLIMKIYKRLKRRITWFSHHQIPQPPSIWIHTLCCRPWTAGSRAPGSVRSQILPLSPGPHLFSPFTQEPQSHGHTPSPSCHLPPSVPTRALAALILKTKAPSGKNPYTGSYVSHLYFSPPAFSA